VRSSVKSDELGDKMKSKEYRRSLLTIAVLAMALLCPGQAITTKDLQLAGDAQSAELVKIMQIQVPMTIWTTNNAWT